MDVKGHIPSTCLDAPRMWFSTGISSINRTFKWLCLKTRQTLKMAKKCTVSRLERQFATLCLFHAPTRISPPRKKCQCCGCYTDLYSFSSFWALFGRGGKTKFCGHHPSAERSIREEKKHKFEMKCSLDGGNSALVIGF